jgi:hypothetical protein
MASKTRQPHQIQAWVPTSLVDRVRAQAQSERRSVSAWVRLAIEDRLENGDGPRGQR